MVEYGAQMFPSFAGVSAPAGQTSRSIERVKAPSMATTASGDRRRRASGEQAATGNRSMTQAGVPGWAGHQVAPLSVASTSITTKNTVTATKLAVRCLLNHARTGFTKSRYDSFGPQRRAAEPS